MKRFYDIPWILVLAAVLIFGMIGTGTAAEYTLKLHYEQATTAPLPTYGFEPWARDLEKVTNGRVKVQIYMSKFL